MLSYIFMGSPGIAATVLDSLCREYGTPQLVITQTPKATGRGKQIMATAVGELARKRNLPLLETDNINDPALVEQMASKKVDLVLVVAFGQILKEPVLKVPKLFCLNLHASLLPKYRGAAPVQWAILNGDKETGVTIQRMVKKLDAGDLLHAEKIPISPEDTSGTLLEKLSVLGGKALLTALEKIESGKHEFSPQDPSQVTFASKIDKAHACISWDQSCEKILNHVRAMQPWPVAETTLGSTKLKIFRATCLEKSGLKPKEIATDHRTFLHVGCADGTALSLTEVQLENRKRLEIKEFLSAFRGQFPFQWVG